MATAVVQVGGQWWESTGGWVPVYSRVWYTLWVPQILRHRDHLQVLWVEGCRGSIWALANICNSTDQNPLVREAVVLSAPGFPHWRRDSPSPSLCAQPHFPDLAHGEVDTAVPAIHTQSNLSFILEGCRSHPIVLFLPQ